MDRVRGPFNLNSAAIIAGAAAIRDRAHVAAAKKHNELWLAYLTDELTKLGIRVTPSVGNFLLLHFPDTADKSASSCRCISDQSRGLILRAVGSYGFPNALRLTVGSEEANRLVVEALTEFMER